MKSVLLFIFLGVSFCSVGQNVADTMFFSNASIKSIGKSGSNGPVGKWVYFFPNGEKNADLRYSDGELSGIQRYFSFNGELLAVETYTNGLLEDSAYYYHENGQLE